MRAGELNQAAFEGAVTLLGGQFVEPMAGAGK